MRPAILLLIVIYLLWQPASTCAAVTNERWAELMAKGREYQDSDRTKCAQYYEQALAQAEALGEDDPRLTATLFMLGDLYTRRIGKPQQAVMHLERQQAILTKLAGPNYKGLADGMELLAIAYRDAGRYSDAERTFFRALEIRPNYYTLKNKDYYFDLMRHLADCYKQWKKPEKAEATYMKILEYLSKQKTGLESDDTRLIYFFLGDLYHQAHRYPDALAAHGRGLQLSEKHPEWGSLGGYAADAAWDVAKDYDAMRQYERALAYYKLSAKYAKLWPDNWFVEVQCYFPGIAKDELNLKHYAQAEQAAHKALELIEPHPDSHYLKPEINSFIKDVQKERQHATVAH